MKVREHRPKQGLSSLALIQVVTSLITVPAATSQDFKVSGSLTFQSFTQNRTVTQHFEVTVSGCRALILSSNTDSHAGYMVMNPRGGFIPKTNFTDRVSIEEGIENGTVYRLTRFFHEGGVNTAASIDAFEVPADEISGINYLWFAYGSACYFQQQTNPFLEPIWTFDDPELKRQHFREKADWSVSERPPFLPTKVSYYSDGKLRWRNAEVGYTNSAPAPYDHGFTNFHL